MVVLDIVQCFLNPYYRLFPFSFTHISFSAVVLKLIAACNLINNDMKQFIISSETDAIREVEDRVSSVLISGLIIMHTISYVSSYSSLSNTLEFCC